MTVQGLLKIIQKFEKTSSFHAQSVREKKRIDSTVVKEVIAKKSVAKISIYFLYAIRFPSLLIILRSNLESF